MKKNLWMNIFFLVLLLSSCKSYLPIDRIKPKIPKEQQSIMFEERQLERLHVGDSLQIYQLEEEPLFLIFHSVSTDSIRGVVVKKGTKKLDVPIDSGILINQVKAIEVRKKDSTKTWLVIGLSLPVFILSIALIDVAINGYGYYGW